LSFASRKPPFVYIAGRESDFEDGSLGHLQMEVLTTFAKPGACTSTSYSAAGSVGDTKRPSVSEASFSDHPVDWFRTVMTAAATTTSGRQAVQDSSAASRWATIHPELLLNHFGE
jgi:hypothetical protein